MQQLGRLAAAPQGHDERIEYQLCAHRRLHRPANHLPREQIDDSRHVDPMAGLFGVPTISFHLLYGFRHAAFLRFARAPVLASATHQVKAQVRPSFRGGDARARGKSG